VGQGRVKGVAGAGTHQAPGRRPRAPVGPAGGGGARGRGSVGGEAGEDTRRRAHALSGETPSGTSSIFSGLWTIQNFLERAFPLQISVKPRMFVHVRPPSAHLLPGQRQRLGSDLHPPHCFHPLVCCRGFISPCAVVSSPLSFSQGLDLTLAQGQRLGFVLYPPHCF